MQDVVANLISIYSNKLDEDIRTPSYEFAIPGFEGTFGVVGGLLTFWIQVATLLPFQSAIRIFLACIVYKFIIQKRGTLTSYAVGYGVVLPFVILMPFYVIPLFDIRNSCLMITISSTPVFVVFNCLEAMYGTSPPGVETDLWTYCMYYSSPIPFLICDETKQLIRANKEEVLYKAKWFLINMALLSLFFTILIPFDYAPFPSPRRIGQAITTTSVVGLFTFGSLLNNYILALLTYVSLDGGMLGVAAGISWMTGFSCVAVMHSPMTESTSPSDFWGRRWNRMIHAVLKRGVYLPLRKYFSKTTASIGTFLVSGLLHEYVLAIIFLKGNVSSDEQRRNYGMHMAFFAFNGMVVMIEYALKGALKGNKLLGEFQKALPKTVVTALVLLTVIPVSHWFTDEYVLSGFYSDYSLGFPKIVYTP